MRKLSLLFIVFVLLLGVIGLITNIDGSIQAQEPSESTMEVRETAERNTEQHGAERHSETRTHERQEEAIDRGEDPRGVR